MIPISKKCVFLLTVIISILYYIVFQWINHQEGFSSVIVSHPCREGCKSVQKPLHGTGECVVTFNCSKDYNPPFYFRLENVTFKTLYERFPDVAPGGIWEPKNCRSRHKLAIIIPYRDREEHLKIFLANMIAFLKEQKRAFRLFVVNQVGDVLFNRGLLFDVGFAEAQKLGNYTCYITHDVDMIPKRICNFYQCEDTEALHYTESWNVDPPLVKMPLCLGGVLAFGKSAFIKVNGYSTIMFGWGGEDDALRTRLVKSKVTVRHQPKELGDYIRLVHGKEATNPSSGRRGKMLHSNAEYRHLDGISSLNDTVTYTLRIKDELLYTNITVNFTIGPKTVEEIEPFFINKQKEFQNKNNNSLAKG